MFRTLKIVAMPVMGLIAWATCSTFTGSAQEKGGQPISVYVAALKGECQPSWQFLPAVRMNGSTAIVSSSGGPPMPPNLHPTILTRFLEDPISQQLAEEEFRKHRAFRLVDSPAQADFVFCLCTQYRELKMSPEMQKRMKMPATLRIGTQAGAVSVESYLKIPQDARALAEAAFWKSDSMTDQQPNQESEKDKKNRKEKKGDRTNAPVPMLNGQPIAFQSEVLPYDLVRRLIKNWPAVAQKIAAQPKPAAVAAAEPAGKPLPKLITDPLGAAKAAPKADASPADSEALRIETALVVVPVMAMDRDGKYLPGLQAADFAVFEDGVKQEISDFGSAENPFHVALVLDVSGSTRFKLEDIQDAALNFVDQLRPQDRVMVVSFDQQVRVDAEFTNEREKLMRAILRTRPGGGTRLLDALDLVLTERLNKIQGRKAIVVFTDGVENSSWLANWQDVMARFEESGVIAYPVRYDTLQDFAPPALSTPLPSSARVVNVVGNGKEEYERAVHNLKALAAHSGGRYYEVATISDTKQAFANIADELRRYYWLGYYPTNAARDGGYRKIRVTVSKPEAALRTREGYRAAGGNETGTGGTETRPKLKNTKP